jgi:hypothetical protein
MQNENYREVAMKCFLTVIIFVVLTVIISPIYGQWLKHTIDPNLTHATIVDVADIDEDGDLDIAANGSDKVQWYENNLPDTNWTPHIIDNSFGGGVGIAIADIDGDSKLDVVANGYGSQQIRWYKNNLPDTNWSPYIIEDYINGAAGLVVVDIDADGDSDVVDAGTSGNRLAWYENNLPNPWIPHIIDNLLGANNPDVGDIDCDGDWDVVAVGIDERIVCWYENNLPNTNWNRTDIADSLYGAFGVRIGDIDGDDTLDVVATGLTESKVVWYKNENAGQTWTEYTITDSLGARNVNVGYIDADNTLDVVATAYYEGDVVWFENDLPNHWIRHNIDTDLFSANWVCAADINGSHRLDVIATGWAAGDLNWYENPIITLPAAPILIEPENNAQLDSDTVKFVWYKSLEQVTKYWLELDTTDQFSAPVFRDSTITDTTLLYTSLINGEYWWRVKAGNLSNWGEFSEVRMFDVVITSIEDDNQLPTVFSLEQNFPNPFNPRTTINYQIPELSFVTLKVYDVLGKEVATLVSDEKSIGNYEIKFDASLLSGSVSAKGGYASGVYFYQIKAGDFVETKKMVLMK